PRPALRRRNTGSIGRRYSPLISMRLPLQSWYRKILPNSMRVRLRRDVTFRSSKRSHLDQETVVPCLNGWHFRYSETGTFLAPGIVSLSAFLNSSASKYVATAERPLVLLKISTRRA